MNPTAQIAEARARLAQATENPDGQLGAVLAGIPVALLAASPSGEVEHANAAFSALSGLATGEAHGRGWTAALHPEDEQKVSAWWTATIGSGRGSACTHRFCRPGGSVVRIECRLEPLAAADGAPVAWIATYLDQTAQHVVSETSGDDRFRIAFEAAPAGLGLVEPDGTLLEVNRAFCRLLGYEKDDLLAINLSELTAPGDALVKIDESEEIGSSETRYLRGDGTALWVAASTTLVRDGAGEPLYYIVQIEDIGDRKQTERELRRLADHDSLTGLLNRRGFMDGLRRELRRMERKGEYGALLLLDLDNFKLVNDTAGHLAGDQVLRTTADVLRRRLRATDVIGRLGGDEFAALVLNVTPRQASEIAGETTEALRALTVTAGDVVLEVTASIGVIAIDELRDENEEDLIAAADRAMYRAKSLRHNG